MFCVRGSLFGVSADELYYKNDVSLSRSFYDMPSTIYVYRSINKLTWITQATNLKEMVCIQGSNINRNFTNGNVE